MAVRSNYLIAVTDDAMQYMDDVVAALKALDTTITVQKVLPMLGVIQVAMPDALLSQVKALQVRGKPAVSAVEREGTMQALEEGSPVPPTHEALLKSVAQQDVSGGKIRA